jgi:hypothetical protein
MFSNRLAFAALAIACIVAAAGGGYIATRQNAVPAPAVAQTAQTIPTAQAEPAPVAPAGAVTAPTPASVQETEAVVGDRSQPKTSGTGTRRADSGRPANPRDSKLTARQAQQLPPLTSTWPSRLLSSLRLPLRRRLSRRRRREPTIARPRSRLVRPSRPSRLSRSWSFRPTRRSACRWKTASRARRREWRTGWKRE